MLVGGEIELGVQQIPELMSVNGAEIIGLLPVPYKPPPYLPAGVHRERQRTGCRCAVPTANVSASVLKLLCRSVLLDIYRGLSAPNENN